MALVLKILLGIGKTFIFFGLGASALKWKIFDKSEVAHFSRFAIDVLTPFLTFYSIVKNFSRQDGAAFWQLPLLGFGIVFFNMLCGYGLQYGLKNKTPRRMATFVHLAAVNNYLYLPLILVDSLYGMKAVAYLFLMSMGTTVGFWTCGMFALAGTDYRKAMKNICNTNIAAVLLAVPCVLLEIHLPEPLLELCYDIGKGSIPLCLMLTGGAIFAAGKRLTAFRYDAFYMLAVRLLILPALTVLLLKLLPVKKELLDVGMIVALMPASCASALIVKQYGGSSDFAGQSIMFSTVCSAATIPLFLFLIELWG